MRDLGYEVVRKVDEELVQSGLASYTDLRSTLSAAREQFLRVRAGSVGGSLQRIDAMIESIDLILSRGTSRHAD